jgi:hypothetical protein
MSCPFANIETIAAATIKPTLRPDPQVGTLIILYDQRFIWTEEHRPPSELNKWRKRGDAVIDCFFDQFGAQLQDGEDTYEFIQQLSEQHQSIEDHDGSHLSSVINFGRQIRQPPAWFNRELAQRGQHFFLKNCSIANMVIFHYTLLLGYGFQQLNDVLMKTQYLASADLKLTYRRLIETTQMIATAVAGHIDNFDQTFSDVVRVRLLHGMVRHKIMKHSRVSMEEVPINQEDSLITLLGFSFSLLYCMEDRLNIPVSDEDKEAYLHLWRYIGWLIGIEDEFLHYLTSYRSARTISESIFYHFYRPSSTSKHMVHHALMALYSQGLVPVSFKFYVGIAQTLLGKEIAHALDIDQPNIDAWLSTVISFIFGYLRFINWLSRWNFVRVNEWIMERNRRVLCYLIYTGLNDQLCNFALFRSYQTSIKGTESVTLKDCRCGYYQKKSNGVFKTKDTGLFQVDRLSPLSAFLQQSLCILAIVLIIRYWTFLFV